MSFYYKVRSTSLNSPLLRLNVRNVDKFGKRKLIALSIAVNESVLCEGVTNTAITNLRIGSALMVPSISSILS